MSKKFWSGFTAGAVAGAGAAGASLLAWRVFGRTKNGRIIRLEKSIQIGRPVSEVFHAWSRLEDLPSRTGLVQEVRSEGDHSRWVMNLGGRLVRWEAEVTQRINNEAIGWKSVGGPKHTGRIDFSPLGDNTIVHITMNYAPPGQMGNLFSPLWARLEHYIEQALRDFKASLEGKGQEGAGGSSAERIPVGSVTPTPAMNQQRATGTYGAMHNGPDAVSRLDQHTQATRFGGAPESTVEYTAPPDAKR
ncbi:MAG TPA: SRPBCC family protein [Terriglobales bacterium]|nr:SRPBCC family protein [Terriglobales bacterium]